MKIGGIYAEIRAKRDKLKGDLDAAGKDIESAAGKMGKSIASIGFKAAGLAAAAFGAAVATAIKQGVESSAQLERQMLRTESIIRATGNAAGLTSKQMLDMANKLDLATLNNRDQILDGINAMQTFKSVSGETFERSIELAVDLAEVMGTDLRSQVVQLGKALEDPKTGLSALRRVGVSFTDQQKEMITTLVDSNKMLEAQGLILDAIAGQVGGAAEGSAGGLAGKIDTLSFRWREFTEVLAEFSAAGKTTASVIDSISEALRGMSDAFRGPTTEEQIAKVTNRLQTMLNIYEMSGGKTGIDPEAIKEKIAALSDIGDSYSLDYGGQDTGGGIATGGGSTATGKGGFQSGIIAGIPDEVSDYGDDSMQALLDWEQELYEEKLNKQKEYIDSAKAIDADHWDWILDRESEMANQRVRIEEWQRDTRKKIGLDTVSNFGKALQLMGQQQRWAFEAFKTYQIAEAVITGISAAVKAWDAGMSTGGPWAPYIAAAYAASSIAWTGAQIAAISSSSFSGGGGGSTPSSGPVGTYSANPTTGVFEPEADTQKTLTININGDVLNPTEFARAIVEEIDGLDEYDVFINAARGTK